MERSLEWAAGLFEGEGTIIIRKARLKNREKSDTIDVQLSSIDYDVLSEFCRIIQVGKIYGPYGPYQPNRKPFWKWSVYGENAIRVLKDLEPFLLSRRRDKAIEALNINKQS